MIIGTHCAQKTLWQRLHPMQNKDSQAGINRRDIVFGNTSDSFEKVRHCEPESSRAKQPRGHELTMHTMDIVDIAHKKADLY
jgi:hypothetical protein